RLDAGVCVVVADDVLAARSAVGAGREAGGDAGRDAPHPQQQGHRAGELLAVSDTVGRQEAGEGNRALGRRLAVAEPVREIPLDGAHVLIRGVRAGRQAARERVGLRVWAGAQRGLALAEDDAAQDPGRGAALAKRWEGDVALPRPGDVGPPRAAPADSAG